MTSFTIDDIARILYRVGVPENLIAFEICSLADLTGNVLSYDELQDIMRKANEEKGQ